MANYLCKHCGAKMSTISGLTTNSCSRNPNGRHHELYEGGEKSKYTCKHCGTTNSTFSGLVTNSCSHNEEGKYHEVAL